jgi:hypothetical protein
MPRGPGKPANYNLNYSRFNGVDDDGSEVAPIRGSPEPASSPDEDMADMRSLLRNMPGELQEAYRLMMISRESGDKAAEERANELALKAIERGSPQVKQDFLNELSKKAPEAAAVMRSHLQVNSAADGPVQGIDAVGNRIDALRAQMEAGAQASREHMETLQKQQEQLEMLKSPEDMIRFFKEGGLADVDLQRIFTGDQDHMERCMKDMLDKAAGKRADLDFVESQVKAAEDLHRSIVHGEEPTDLPDGPEEAKVVAEPDPEPAKGRKETAEPPCLIPDHRLQYHKDESGNFSLVELKCSLPGIKDISAIALDISEKYLRLNTVAPKFAVNAGPFPVLIEPSAARAKFSKKKEELSITVPTKAER